MKCIEGFNMWRRSLGSWTLPMEQSLWAKIFLTLTTRVTACEVNFQEAGHLGITGINLVVEASSS